VHLLAFIAALFAVSAGSTRAVFTEPTDTSAQRQQAADANCGFFQTDVFFAGQLGYREFRIPALVVTKSGRLLAVSEAGWTSADAGDRDILLRSSDDGGRTWSRQVDVIVDMGSSRCGSPACLVDSNTRRIHLIAAVDYTNALQLCSDDDGQTWSKLADITSVFGAFKDRWQWTGFDTGPARGIELERGGYKGRFVQPVWFTVEHKRYRSAVIYSDDRGATWKPGGLINEEHFNTNECSVYEAADGTLWMNMRGGDSLPAEKRRPFRLIAKSSDGGLTWSKTHHDDNLTCPQCLASTLRYSWPEQGRSRLLFANPADRSNRINMTVRLSYDEGRSWPVSRQIFAGPSAYSCLARLPNGGVGLLYERGDKHRYEKLTFARFTLKWLERGKGKVESTGSLDQ